MSNVITGRYITRLIPLKIKRSVLRIFIVAFSCSCIVHTNSGVTDLGYPLRKVLGARHVVHLREFQDIDFGIEPLTG